MKEVVCLQSEIAGKLPGDIITVTQLTTGTKFLGKLGHIIRPELRLRNNPAIWAVVEIID